MVDSKQAVHIINVPLDLGASRRGTDAGPSAFRVAGLSAALQRLGYTVSQETDIPVPAMETRKTDNASARFKDEILTVCQELASTTLQVMDAGEIPLVIGGDHSIAMGTVSGLSAHFAKAQKRLGLIWFDAHGDMNLPESSPSGNIHGMPLSHLIGMGDPDLSNILGAHPAVDVKNVVLIGIRDIDRIEREIINKSGVTAFTMREIDEIGMARVARRALEIVNDGTAGFHVSFDLDGCDPEVIPGTGTTVPGGVSYREAHLLLEECAAHGGMTSMEVVELNPFLDHRNVSAERAVTLIQSAFGRSIL
ncbi:arginase [Woeseia oceani]|uniref:Arginase n=1 Tax=Woeseia oceani TaxID=1548547 RepID=A0A193LJC8_9GAMM|nr:arginase [Woeseia oceani]ANO52538.1 arginase [Woeseia oceani]